MRKTKEDKQKDKLIKEKKEKHYNRRFVFFMTTLGCFFGVFFMKDLCGFLVYALTLILFELVVSFCEDYKIKIQDRL